MIDDGGSRAVSRITIDLDPTQLSPKAIVGEDDLSPILTDPHCLTRGKLPYCVPFNDAWQRAVRATALIVDKKTVEAIRNRKLHTLEELAVAMVSPRVRTLNHRLAQARIAVPANRALRAMWRHIVPHTGFMIRENIVVSVKHGVAQTALKNLRFVFGAKWNPITRYFDLDEHNIYKVDLEEDDKKARLRVCKNSDCVAYRVKPVISGNASPVQPVDVQRDVLENTPVTALTHALGLATTTIGREPTRPCDINQCVKYHCYAALDVFFMSSGSPVVIATDEPKVVGMIRSQSRAPAFERDEESGEAILAHRNRGGNQPMAGILKIRRILEALEHKQWI